MKQFRTTTSFPSADLCDALGCVLLSKQHLLEFSSPSPMDLEFGISDLRDYVFVILGGFFWGDTPPNSFS